MNIVLVHVELCLLSTWFLVVLFFMWAAEAVE